MVKVKWHAEIGKQKHFIHYKQLNAFDHPYHIHKYLDSEPSTFLPVNVPKPFQCCQMNIHLFMSPTYGFLVGPISKMQNAQKLNETIYNRKPD